MTDQHPITPPPELIKQWVKKANHNDPLFAQVAVMGAQWGSDQELEACCEWLVCNYNYPEAGNPLRATRRPKPPSLKEQALAAQQRMWDGTSNHDDWNLIRRALEQLDD